MLVQSLKPSSVLQEYSQTSPFPQGSKMHFSSLVMSLHYLFWVVFYVPTVILTVQRYRAAETWLSPELSSSDLTDLSIYWFHKPQGLFQLVYMFSFYLPYKVSTDLPKYKCDNLSEWNQNDFAKSIFHFESIYSLLKDTILLQGCNGCFSLKSRF